MVWLVDWSWPEQHEYLVTLFTSEADATQSACAEMLEFVGQKFDFYNARELYAAKEINRLVSSGLYPAALEYYSDYVTNNWDYDRRQLWYIYEKDTFTYPHVPIILNFPTEAAAATVTYDCSKSGATCRGPCHLYNEYAVSDQCDGTYMCHGCKVMNNFFSGK